MRPLSPDDGGDSRHPIVDYQHDKVDWLFSHLLARTIAYQSSGGTPLK